MDFQIDFINRISLSSVALADFVFFLIAAFTAAMSVILFYHWQKYVPKGLFMTFMELIYLGVTTILLAIMFFSLN